MRLIDADGLKAYVEKRLPSFICGIIDIYENIDVVPRAAVDQLVWEKSILEKQLKDIGVQPMENVDDVVRVVRCKDCCHSSEHPFIDNTIDCYKLDITVGEDFFCADGIRGLD